MINSTSILLYLLASTGMMAAFYAYYVLVLKGSGRFKLNRVYLLGSLAISVLAPLAGFSEVVTGSLTTMNPIAFSLPTVVVGNVAVNSPSPSFLSGLSILMGIYLLGIGVSLIFFSRKLVHMAFFLKGKKRVRQQGYTLIPSQGQVETASFFRLLIWNDKADLTETEKQQVLAHELCHIRQLHSLDLLWVELLRMIFWFNPLLYLYRTSIRQTHEFLADQAAIHETGGKGYAHLLLRQVLEGPSTPPAHPIVIGSYFKSQIKIRMKMMKKTNQPRRVLLRYLMALPFTFLFVLVGCGLSGQSAPTAPSASTAATSPTQPTAPTQPMTSTLAPTSPKPPKPPVPPVDGVSQEPDQMPAPVNLLEIATDLGKAKKDQGIKGEGKAIVKLLIDKKGNVAEHEWLKQLNPEIDALVEDALSKLEFSPGIKDGKKVKVWVTLPFQFTDQTPE